MAVGVTGADRLHADRRDGGDAALGRARNAVVVANRDGRDRIWSVVDATLATTLGGAGAAAVG